MARPQKTAEQILKNHVVMESGCHAYIGDNGPILNRRPTTKNDGKCLIIARQVYQLVYGNIPEGLVVRHTCDTEWCVNPLHLVAGTHKQNSTDMVERNRQSYGSRNGSSKLSESTIASIRSEWIPRLNSMAKIAKKYNLAVVTVSSIINGRSWGHVSGSRKELRKVECSRGHLLIDDNVITRTDGRIECKTCRQAKKEEGKEMITQKHLEAYRKRQLIGFTGTVYPCECGAAFKSQRSLTLHKTKIHIQLIEREETK